MAEHASRQTQEQLKELTECCICAESFTDPKMLPCLHTFCSGCLQEMAEASSKRPGDRMPCPVCRREYQIPSDGFAGLPRNFLMDRLVEIAAVAKPSSPAGAGGGEAWICDQCSRRNTRRETSEIDRQTHPETTGPQMLLYCVECGRKLCEKCCRKHRKNAQTKPHQLLEFGSQVTLDEMLQNGGFGAQRVCDRHPGKRLRTYCSDCSVVVCSACFLDRHRSHNGSPLAKVVDGFRSQLDRAVDSLSSAAGSARDKKTQIETERLKFMKRISTTERKLVEVTQELKDLIDAQSAAMLTHLAHLNRQYLSETQTLIEDIDRNAADAEDYLSRATDVKANGSAVDIYKVVGELSVRAKELTEAQETLFARKPRPLQPSFRGTELLNAMRDKKMQFGIVEENVDYSGDSSLMCTVRPSASLPQKKPIWGATVLGSELFLVTDKDASIEAFDTTTFSSTRRWSVDGMNDPQDIRSCPRLSCLYVFNWKGTGAKEILRICPETRSVVKRWGTGADAGRLSVAADTNLLLAVHNNNKLNEYAAASPGGKLVAEVRLDFVPGCNHPWHAVKLSRDQYLVGYGDVDDRNHGVCVVDATRGLVLRSFGGRRGRGLDGVDVPMNVGVDAKGSVFVADHNNGRVLVLNGALQAPRVLISTAQGLRKPIRLALDERSGRLYVADLEFDFETRKWQEGEVLVIRIK